MPFCGPQTETQDSLDDSLLAHGEEGISCSEFSLSIQHAVFYYLNVSVRRAWVMLQKQTARSQQLKQSRAISRTSCISTGANRGVLLTTHLGTLSSESTHLEHCLRLCRGERRGELRRASRWSLNSQPRSDTYFHSKRIVQKASCGPPCTNSWGRSEILLCTWKRAIWRYLGE